MDKWIKKMSHTYTGIFNHEKKENSFICNNMENLKDIVLSKKSQIEKYKYSIVALICGI